MRKFKYKVTSKNGKSVVIHPKSPYCLDYNIGSTTYAQEGTHGIMVFKTLTNAMDWMNHWWQDMRVMRVIPSLGGFTPKVVSREIQTRHLHSFYKLMDRDNDDWKYYLSYNTAIPITGTMCYPSVYVHSEVDLEEEQL